MGGRVIEKKEREREKKNSLTRRDRAWVGAVGDRISKFIARGALGNLAKIPGIAIGQLKPSLINLSYRLIVFREERGEERMRRFRRLETRGLRERDLIILLLSNDGRNVVSRY